VVDYIWPMVLNRERIDAEAVILLPKSRRNAT
jgi:hypothetical protein